MRWADAMQAALYGDDGFYRRSWPAEHFRTSVTASAEYAAALGQLLQAIDAALGRPDRLDVVDLGAGDARLSAGILAALPAETRSRVHAVAVEVRDRPPGLPADIGWGDHVPEQVQGLVVANEFLDNIPCDVVQRDGESIHWLLVDPRTGDEQVGAPVDGDTAEWLDRWWPLADGDRAELGRSRDEAWGRVVTSLVRGVALAVDYGHVREERATGRFASGTLTGYGAGRQQAPVPDGSCDLTAHVAIDSCAAAGTTAGASSTLLCRQADALRGLGLRAERPTREQAHTDPPGYIAALSRAAHTSELLDPTGLGGFWWLLQAKQCPVRIGDVQLG